MRTSLFLVLLVSMTLLLTGCGGGASLDTTSLEGFRRSVAEVAATLDGSKRTQFETAVNNLMIKHVLSNPEIKGEADAIKKIKQVFGGQSVDQIIAMGDQLKPSEKISAPPPRR